MQSKLESSAICFHVQQKVEKRPFCTTILGQPVNFVALRDTQLVELSENRLRPSSSASSNMLSTKPNLNVYLGSWYETSSLDIDIQKTKYILFCRHRIGFFTAGAGSDSQKNVNTNSAITHHFRSCAVFPRITPQFRFPPKQKMLNQMDK